jgi:hypothetical protein
VRFLLAHDSEDSEGMVQLFYVKRERDGVEWTKDDKAAWDFGTRNTAESIRERDRYLKHCSIVERR